MTQGRDTFPRVAIIIAYYFEFVHIYIFIHFFEIFMVKIAKWRKFESGNLHTGIDRPIQ